MFGLAGIAAVLWLGAAVAQEPTLPPGLEPQKEPEKAQQPPALSEGLEPPPAEEPTLPEGLGAPAPGPKPQAETGRAGWRDHVSGFVEGRAGWRTGDDPYQKQASIGEGRAQIAAEYSPPQMTLRLVGDFIYDDVNEKRGVDLETGQGWFDLREANAVFRPLPFADVKIGRQILTWGTGDLVFINDLFPKDYQSFFIGRDEEYLKAPSDAIRVSTFFDLVNLDVVYTPRFDSDRSLEGSRLTIFNPMSSMLSGQNAVIAARRPDGWFGDDEIAVRAYRNVGRAEVALYAYDGYWKSPGGVSPDGTALYPDLRVFGASVRGPAAGGIAHAEFGHYDSRDDRAGTNPMIENSQMRFLAGFEREALPELTVGVQYYAVRQGDYEALLASLPPGARVPDHIRHTLTLRLTKQALRQTLTLSLFNFWSPNDDDGHVRLRASYKITDAWRMEMGANVFYGPDERTFFGQLKTDTNVFVAVRRSF